jgi:hypothetical protein
MLLYAYFRALQPLVFLDTSMQSESVISVVRATDVKYNYIIAYYLPSSALEPEILAFVLQLYA